MESRETQMTEIMNVEISREEVKARNEREKQLQDNLQTATKYLTAIGKYNEYTPQRGLAEFAQNVRDAGATRLGFTQKEGHFITWSNQKPMTFGNLRAFIKRVSSLDKGHGNATGKFSTGSITTDCLGRKIIIRGSIDAYDGKTFINVNDNPFVIDMSSADPEILAVSVGNMLTHLDQLFDEWNITNACAATTSFDHIVDNDYYKGNGDMAISKFKKVSPDVLVFNPQFESITFEDSDRIQTISRSGEAPFGSDGLQKITILGISQHPQSYFVLRNADGSIILPLHEVPVSNDLSALCGTSITSLPRIYCQDPLFGTEDTGAPVIMNAAGFQVRETRDGLVASEKNPANEKNFNENERIMNSLDELYLTWLVKQNNIVDAWPLLTVDFHCSKDADDKDKKLRDQRHQLYVETFMKCHLFPVKVDGIAQMWGFREHSNLRVLAPEIVKAYDEGAIDDDALSVIYKAASKAWVLPERNHIIDFSRAVATWKRKELLIGCKDICSHMPTNIDTTSEGDVRNHHILVDSLTAIIGDGALTEYSLIPNKQGVLYKKQSLVIAKVPDEFYSCAMILLPEDAKTFVLSTFEKFTNKREYKVEDFHKNLGYCLDNLRNAYTNRGTALPLATRNTLIAFCCISANENASTARRLEVMANICEIDGINQTDANVVIEGDSNEVRLFDKAFNLTVENTMLELSGKSSWYAEHKTAWINVLRSVTACTSLNANILSKYKIWPDKNGHLRKAEEIHVNADVDDDMVDLYANVTAMRLQDNWAEPECAGLYDFQKDYRKNVAAAIQSKLQEVNFTSSYVLQIVSRVDSDWKGLFPLIEAQKEDFFFKNSNAKLKKMIFELAKHANDTEGDFDLNEEIRKMKDARKREIGDEGEAFVYKLLRKRFGEENVKWSNLSDEQHADRHITYQSETFWLATTSHNFDFEVLTSCGKLFIETKTTVGRLENSDKFPLVFLTKEFKWIDEHHEPNDRHLVARVFDVEGNPQVYFFEQKREV